MHSDTINKLNGVGVMFRLITPVFQFILGILSAIILLWLGGLKTDMKTLQTHFENHLSEHKQMEVVYERRLSILEAFVLDKKGIQ